MMFDMKLRPVSPMLNHLLAGALCVVGLTRPFSHSFVSEPVESAYAGERPVRDASRLSCNGRLLVSPWPWWSPLKGSLQYDKKIARCMLTIAHL
jgi:hypothetical protein